MGCSYELNDTLVLKSEQGFPEHIFDYEKHQNKPVRTEDVEEQLFTFHNKSAARAFQLDPVRVFLFQCTVDGKWLAWGKALIQTLHIEHTLDRVACDNASDFCPDHWVTSGSYKILEVYPPDYQKMFTLSRGTTGEELL